MHSTPAGDFNPESRERDAIEYAVRANWIGQRDGTVRPRAGNGRPIRGRQTDIQRRHQTLQPVIASRCVPRKLADDVGAGIHREAVCQYRPRG